ncbi:encapsulin [Halonatronum saccharophilum]|uniref:encapsulin n=1 Tax=Halonatronum saccharophilum TaxID=150060 RepID=UPI000A0058EB
MKPLIELEIPFKLSFKEVEALIGGAEDIDIDALVEGAEKIARAEDEAIFYGVEEGEIRGLL